MRRTFVLLVVALLSVIAVPSLASAQDSASTATTAQSCHLSTTGAAGPKLGFGYTITGKHRLANYNQTGCWGAKRFPGSSRSMQSVACGIVSMSMAATTLTGQPWHPMRVARKLKYVMSGGNMYWYAPPKMDRMETAGPKFGLWVHNVGRSYAKVKAAVQQGGLAIFLFRGGGRFTGGGHFIVGRAADSHGVYLADPYGLGEFGHNNERAPFKWSYLKAHGLATAWVAFPAG
jgi:hypothetical protein